MLRSECVLSRVLIRRGVTTQRHAAGLAGSQVNPASSDLYTLLTLTPLRKLDELNRFNMRANLFSHTLDFTPRLHREELKIKPTLLSRLCKTQAGLR
jgi:hypothetical protein